MKALITGSSGFIAGHLVNRLKTGGCEIAEIDPRIHPLNTILNDDLVNELIKDCELLFHLGAAAGSLWFTNPRYACKINNEGTLNLLEACRKNDTKIIFSSTTSSMAFTPIPHREENTLYPLNFYSASKIFNEHSIKLYNELYGIDAVILRYFSVYGPGEKKKGNLANVVSQFIFDVIDNKSPVIFGDGNQYRDFIYVDDVVEANLHAAKLLSGAEVYNIGTGIKTNFNELLQIIYNTLGKFIDIIYKPISKTNIKAVQRHYVLEQLADISKIQKTGWSPKVSIKEGIRRIIDYELKSKTTISA